MQTLIYRPVYKINFILQIRTVTLLNDKTSAKMSKPDAGKEHINDSYVNQNISQKSLHQVNRSQNSNEEAWLSVHCHIYPQKQIIVKSF